MPNTPMNFWLQFGNLGGENKEKEHKKKEGKVIYLMIFESFRWNRQKNEFFYLEI